MRSYRTFVEFEMHRFDSSFRWGVVVGKYTLVLLEVGVGGVERTGVEESETSGQERRGRDGREGSGSTGGLRRREWVRQD